MKHNFIYALTLVLSIYFLAGCQSKVQKSNQIILYQNANVLDLESRSVNLRHIEVTGSKITNIYVKMPDKYFSDTSSENVKKSIIDLKGHYVLPGMLDMHVHSWGNQSPIGDYQLTGAKGTANANLYAGISGFLDLFSDEDYILNYRNKQFEQIDVEARVFAAGPCFTATNGHCAEYGTDTRIINTPEQVESELSSLALKKPDVLKVVYDHSTSLPTIDKATLNAFVTKAKQLSIKSVVHIGTWDDVRDAAEVGADAITHTPMAKMPADIPDIMLANKVSWIPTLVVQTDWPQFIHNSEVLKRPLLAELTTEALMAGFPVDLADKPKLKAYLGKHEKNNIYALMDDAVKRISDKGVTILVGSDAGNIKSFQGFSFHRELEHLVESGISEWQVLKSASSNPQQFMGVDWQIKIGDQAEFVVFNDSPIIDIKNTQKIYAMVHKGKMVDRQALLPQITPAGWAKLMMYLKFQ